jgi:hypothetical protein
MREPIDPDIVYRAGCGKKHGPHLLADGYIDTRVSTSHSRSMNTSTEDNIHPWKQIKTPIDRIAELESLMGEVHQMLLLSLAVIIIQYCSEIPF